MKAGKLEFDGAQRTEIVSLFFPQILTLIDSKYMTEKEKQSCF